MKIYRKKIYIFLLTFIVFFLDNIYMAKTNRLHNFHLEIGNKNNFKIISWEEVFQEWKLILFRAVGAGLLIVFFYSLMVPRTANPTIKTKKKSNANNAVKTKKTVRIFGQRVKTNKIERM